MFESVIIIVNIKKQVTELENFADGRIRLTHIKGHNFWMRILLIGFVLYVSTVLTFVLTNNTNLFPTVVFIGNFLVPVAFVSFFYERKNRFSVNMPSTSMSFFYGGVLGTIAAAILEPFFIRNLTFSTSFIVGFIEELTKMIGVLLIARKIRHNSQMDGIILGSAAGMGFAAFESTGYAYTAYIQSGGSLSYTVFITLLRGMASPVGHGTWTAILSSVLFRESYSDRFNINRKVVGAYLTVVTLHGLWDGLPLVIKSIIPSLHSVLIGQLCIGAIGLSILYKRWSEARIKPALS